MPADLDFEYAPRTVGRAAAPLNVEVVRDLNPADIALLSTERGIKPRPLEQIRDRHHLVAKLLAQGMSATQVSAITGMTQSRISILKSDPTFRELMADYEKVEAGAYAEFTERATILSLTAMNELQDRLETTPEGIGESMLLEIVKTTADRVGHAPVSKNINLNASVDLGSRMAQARARLAARQAEAAPIEVEVTEVEGE